MLYTVTPRRSFQRQKGRFTYFGNFSLQPSVVFDMQVNEDMVTTAFAKQCIHVSVNGFYFPPQYLAFDSEFHSRNQQLQ